MSGTREGTRSLPWPDVGRDGLRVVLARFRIESLRSSPSRVETSPRAFPGGLLGAIVLIITLECVGIVPEALRFGESGNRVEWSWRAAVRKAAGPEAGTDILCFGDSLIKLGILPRVLEDRLGSSAYNLAVLGGQAPTSYFLLRRVLEHGHRPRALIINFSPLLLAMDPRVNLEWWSNLADGYERLELLWRCGNPSMIASMTVRGGIGSWTARDPVRWYLGLEAGHDATIADDPRVFERNWRMNRGAQVAPRRFVPIAGALPRPYEGGRWRWRPHPVHDFYVDRFLSLAEAHRIPVYWVVTPAVSEWLDRNDGVGTIGAYRQFIRDLLPRFPGLIVVDAQDVGWDHSAFRDPIHLNRDGAGRLSLAVAELIRQCSAGSANGHRWLKPDAQADPACDGIQDLMEDLDQSQAAVARRASGPG